MKVSEFIRYCNEKTVLADITLPKYQNLLIKKSEILKTKLSEDETIVSGSIIRRNDRNNLTNFVTEAINGIRNFENQEQGTLNLSEHIKETLEKDFTNVLEYVKGNLPIQDFNTLVEKYLQVESGYDPTFKIKGSRPGSGNRFLAITGDSNEAEWSNYISIQDQMTLSGGIKQELADKVRPSFIDRLLSVFSKKHHDKIFAESTRAMYRNAESINDHEKKQKILQMKLTVEDFFSQVKLKSNEAENFKNHITTIFKQIRQAKNMGQTALIEKLTSKLLIEVYEGALMAAGYTKYITFSDLKELERKSPKGISIDYPQNFTRIIPEEVIDKKEESDALCIFDQYVILHFDPENKNTKDTITEIEEKKSKDPILFGVILDSPKLYYITDWVDEFCDLTWDKALEILGEEEEKHLLKFQGKKDISNNNNN